MSIKHGTVNPEDLESWSDDELRQRLWERGLSMEGDREQLITRLVEDGYPVYPLPKVNENTIRGIVLGSLVDGWGNPTGGTNKSDIVDRLQGLGVGDRTTAEQHVEQYAFSLVRYYGYTLIRDGDMIRAEKRPSGRIQYDEDGDPV